MCEHITNLPIMGIINVSDEGVFSDTMKSVLEPTDGKLEDAQGLYSYQAIRDRVDEDDIVDGSLKAIIAEVALTSGEISTFTEIRRPGLTVGRRMLNALEADFDGS